VAAGGYMQSALVIVLGDVFGRRCPMSRIAVERKLFPRRAAHRIRLLGMSKQIGTLTLIRVELAMPVREPAQ